MDSENKLASTTKKIFAVLITMGIFVGSWFGYSHYHSNRWLVVKENKNDWVEINGELGKKDSAPCPDMILKQGKAKFIESPTDKGQLQLGYKMTIGSEMGKNEKNPSKYSPYLYQIRFRFTLADKDDFPLQVIEGPAEYEIFEISKSRDFQNVCPKGVPVSTAKNSSSVHVQYILSATGPSK